MRSRLVQAGIFNLALALVLCAIGAAVAQSPQERAEITIAANVARVYDQDLSAFLDKSNLEIRKKASDTIGKSRPLLDLVDKRLKDVPKMSSDGTTAYGRANSDAYQAAVARQKAVLDTYGRLATQLRKRVLPIQSFLDAAKELLLIDPGELLKDMPILSGWPLREHVIPEYEKAQAELKKQEAPPGEDKFFKELKDFAADTIKETKDGAEKLDAGEVFFFEHSELPNQLYRRLIVIDSSLKGFVVREVEAATQGL